MSLDDIFIPCFFILLVIGLFVGIAWIGGAFNDDNYTGYNEIENNSDTVDLKCPNCKFIQGQSFYGSIKIQVSPNSPTTNGNGDIFCYCEKCGYMWTITKK